MVGLFFSMLSIIMEDIGINCFGTCGTVRGSILEYLYVTIIVFVWPYCVYSAIMCGKKLCEDKNTLRD